MKDTTLAVFYTNRRVAWDVVQGLLDMPEVLDLAVFVPLEEGVYVRVATDEAGLTAVKAVLRRGKEVGTGWNPDRLTLGKMGFTEVYRTREGAKFFRGYGYRRRETEA